MMTYNKDDLKSLYTSLENNKFIKVSEFGTLEVLIGVSFSKKVLALRGATLRKKFESTDIVTVFIEDKKSYNQLFFILEDNAFLEVFISLVKDILEEVCNRPTAIIDVGYQRWLLWKNLFTKKTSKSLSEIQVQGLLGELIILNRLMDTIGEERAILSWGGIDFNKKDFECQNTWYEVKTVLGNSQVINISSLIQLDSSIIGYLVLIRFQKTTSENINRLSLNDYLSKLFMRITNIELQDLLITKLNSFNYCNDVLYDSYNYLLEGITYYKVDKIFPRLTKETVPFGIVNAKYELTESALYPFVSDESEALKYD